MKVRIGILLSLAALSAAAGTVEVRFVAPENYRDAGGTARDRQRTTDIVGGYLKSLAAALPDGQTLKIEVKDIDLAGTPRMTPRGDVRVLRGGADWPRLDFTWTLESAAGTLARGEESLADLDYQRGLPPVNDGTELPYEKKMLARWFQQRFSATAPQ